MDIIGVGKTVMIKTIAGNLYSAYISSINKITNLVTLIWFEEGKTITKDVEIYHVLNDPVITIDNNFMEIKNSKIDIIPEIKQELKVSSKILKSNETKINNCDIEEFDSDTKIDSNPRSCCSVLINELKEHGKLFPSVNNDEICDEEDYYVDGRLIRSLHSCHCPESDISLKSKLSVKETVTCNIVTGNSELKVTPLTIMNSKTSNLDLLIKNSFNQPQINSSNHSVLINDLKIQESLKFNLQKREDELQKKIQSNQVLKHKKNKLITLNLGDPSKDTLAMIRECKMSLQCEQLSMDCPIGSHAITVCVRKRPLTQAEYLQDDIDVVSIPNREHVVVHELKSKVNLKKYLDNHKFRFDYGFDETCNNEFVYNYTAKPLIRTIFDGGMATCFAYGQTGAGKTYTVGGSYVNGKTNYEDGICSLAAKDVFKILSELKYNLKVTASFYEIYNGKVYDLLSEKKLLTVLEDGHHKVNIVGLTEKVVTQYNDVLHLIEYGNNIRTSGESSVNKHSSRSHAVFQIILRKENISKILGKFSFIDLAGNERGCDSLSTNRYEMVEAAGINTSLLALKECIRAMGKEKAHLPFRASKLTQVLKDSFTAKNSKTCMIAMISPGLHSCQYTLNTLRYADRVKELAVRDDDSKKNRKYNTRQTNISKRQVLTNNSIPRF